MRRRAWVLWGLVGILAAGILSIYGSAYGTHRIIDLLDHELIQVSYDEAIEQFQAVAARDSSDINAVCRSRLLTHGYKTGRAIVLFHGFTNCPQQFEALGKLLYERGANVLITRIPHHGRADVLTRDLQNLNFVELLDSGDEAINIAKGLGDSVTVAGLSLGGNIAAWIAQERHVDRAVVIAPMFGVVPVWGFLTPPLEWAALRLPDQSIWWDDKAKEKSPGPPYCYPRFSTRALASGLMLGFECAARARAKMPGARSIVVVTVAGDPAVRNEMTADVVRSWRKWGPDRVATYEFPRELGLGHDLIDPLQPYQRVDRVYPVLADLMWPK